MEMERYTEGNEDESFEALREDASIIGIERAEWERDLDRARSRRLFEQPQYRTRYVDHHRD
jgi:hypothetical protein